jgi:ABC-2 type transport system permease protein/ribosome-dependent ATPase
MNWAQVAALVAKEWREILRDRVYFMLAFILPAVLMFVFGYGVTQDVEHVPLAILDEDRSAMSRDYAQHFIASRYFNFRGYLADARAVDRRLAAGDVTVVITIPSHYEERLLAGDAVVVQGVLDGTFTGRVFTIRGYIEAINRAANGELQAMYLARTLGATEHQIGVLLQPLRLQVRYQYNQDLESVWGVAASMLMFILLMTAPLLTSISVVREKETGSIYNIYASSIGRAEFLLGKLIPNVTLSYINALLLWVIAVYYFGAPFRGGALFFFAVTLIYIVCVSTIGLLISLLVSTQQAAIIISIIFAVVSGISFSGMNSPVASMTGANYVVAHLLPAMYYEDVVEGVFLKGAGAATLWPQALVLSGYSLLLLALAHRLFHKRQRP